MKTYQVSVNGEQFTVTVEEVTGAASTQQAAMPAAPPSPTPAAPTKPAPQAPPRPAPAPSPSPAPPADASGTNIQAPMPGKILSIRIKPGDTVNNGDVLIVLEAMKMENDIMAPQDGTIKAVHVAVGDSVNSGDVLITIGT